MVNVTVDYMLKSNKNGLVVNDFVQGESLSKNLDKTLDIMVYVQEILKQSKVILYCK